MKNKKSTTKNDFGVFKIGETEFTDCWICWDCAKKNKAKKPENWRGMELIVRCTYCDKTSMIVPIVSLIWPGQKYYI